MKKEIKIVMAVILIIVLFALVFLLLKQKDQVVEVNKEMLESQSEEAVEETQKIIDEILEGIDVNNDLGDVYELGGVQEITTLTGEVDAEGNPIEKVIKAVAAVSGTSLIDTNSGRVIQDNGEAVNNNAIPGNLDAPQESYVIEDEEQILSSSIKLDVKMDSFSPNTFTVKRGQLVSLVVSNINEAIFSEIFVFEDPSLSAIVIGLAKGDTKSISFNAPSVAGEYVFYSSAFNHRELGAVGKMIVE